MYSDELYQLLLRNVRESRTLNKRIRQIEKEVTEFKMILVKYYEGGNPDIIRKFLKEKCWRNF